MRIIPQPHGGALASGGIPGNRGGGRPPSIVRERCRGSFEQRIPTLELIADSDAEPKDRIRAIDTLGRYGMTAGGVDQHEVRMRLARTVQKITELADPETAETLLAALERIGDPRPPLVLQR